MRIASTLLVVAASSLSCDVGGADDPDRPEGESIGEWLLEEPRLVLGDEDVPFVDIAGAVRLSDGRIVVADAGTSLVHYFSPGGVRVATLGGVGDGPSEFRIIESIGMVSGDTVWVHDFAHQRLAFLGPDGHFVRTVSLRPRLGSGRVVGVLTDGTILAGEAWSSSRVAAVNREGLVREPVAYVSYGRAGELEDTVAVVPGREVVITQENGRGVMGPAPLGRTAVHALVNGRLVLGDQDAPELSVYDRLGQRIGTMSWPAGDLTMTDSLTALWRALRLASVPPGQSGPLEESLESVVFPDRRPAYGAILPGADGDLWVAAYSPLDQDSGSWRVLSARGRTRAFVMLPPRFRPLHVSAGLVVGVARDELDVPRIEIRALVPGS